MNYHQIYNNLINSRKNLNRTKETGIYEKHHIIPKCFGGSNKEENLVFLTYREHFIAHLLLSEMYTGEKRNKMCFALWLMCSMKKTKNLISARQYEHSRRLFLNIMIGRKCSNETKKKMSKSKTGRCASIEAKINMSKNHGKCSGIFNSMYGKKHKIETIKKMKKSHLRHKSIIKPVIQYGLDKNTIIKKWNSIIEASISLNICKENISQVCNGHRNSAGKFYWKFQ